MKVIVPITMTDAKLTSSNITEDDYAVWSDATTYARGDFAISTTTHTVYRSLTDSNLDNDPDAEQVALADPLIDDPSPVNWQIISATNRWKMFDVKPTVPSARADSIVVEITPGAFIGGVAGVNVRGTSVTVEGTLPDDTEVFSETIDLFSASRVFGYYDYFFTPLESVNAFTISDLPLYQTAIWKVTITNAGGTAELGDLVLGQLFQLGEVITPGTGFSGLDFSFVENDEFGNLTRVVREATRLADFELVVRSGSLSTVFSRLNSLRGGRPAVWIADDRPGFDAAIYGFVRDYRQVYQTGDNSIISLQIQGLV